MNDLETQQLIHRAQGLRLALEEDAAAGRPFDKAKFAEADSLLTKAGSQAGRASLERLASNGDTLGDQVPPRTVPVAPETAQLGSGNSPEYDAWRADYAMRTGGQEYREALSRYIGSYFQPNRYGHAQQDVLQSGIDEEGGFLLTVDFVDGILGRKATPSHVFDAVAHRKTARESVTIRRWQKDVTDPSEYTSQIVPSWVAEIPASGAGEVTPKVGLVKVSVDKARVKILISRDELADVDVDLISEIQEAAAPNMRAFMDKAIIAGTGVDQPLGFLTDTAITDNAAATDVSGTTADEISNTSAALGSATKIQDLQASLPVQYRERAVWIMSADSENKIRQLIDANNRFLWGTGLDANPKTLLGDPVIISPWMNDGGTDGDIVIVYGDLEACYQAVLRDSIAAQLDPFSKADVEQVVLYLRFRLGGHTKNVDAVRLGKV